MFISLRRKHLQLFVVLFLLVVVSVSLFQVSSVNPYSYKYNGPASPVLKPAYASANTKEEGYLDKIANKFLEGADVPESSTSAEDDDDDFEWDEQEAHKEEAYFNAKVEEMYEEKVKSDLQHKFWLLDTTMHVESTDLTIPEYYLPKKKHQPKVIKPVIQPFDPRFTLGMYYHAVKVHSIKYPDATTVLPFHWYDWVDLSILDMFLIADEAEKPGAKCSTIVRCGVHVDSQKVMLVTACLRDEQET